MARAAVFFRLVGSRRADAATTDRADALERAPDPVPTLPWAPGRSLWSPPRGRDLLAGVTVIAVLLAVLFVFSSDVPAAPRPGGAEPFARPAHDGRDSREAQPAWEDVPVAPSPAALGPDLERSVSEGLAAARARIAACVALDRRRLGRSPGEAVSPAASPAELVLRLAPRSRAVHVAGVEVVSAGSSPELVACARRLLYGDAIGADGAVPGRRHRLAVQLR